MSYQYDLLQHIPYVFGLQTVGTQARRSQLCYLLLVIAKHVGLVSSTVTDT